jgi:hypothetical protein
VIFVINFGPQRGQEGGCRGQSNVIVSVDGKEATQSAYHVYYANPYNRGQGKDHTYVALEMLIRRELLAQEAERRNMRVTDDMVMDEIKKGHFYLAGERVPIPGILDGGNWNLTVFKNWVGNLNVSRNSYIAEQQRGMLAAMMQQILLDSVVVSREEALSHYLFENNTVQYDVVAFRPETYAEAMRLTDADVERFVSTHDAEVKAKYDADKATKWTGVKPQLKLREIFIAKLEEPKKEEPPPPAPAPAQGSGAGSAAPAAGSAATGSAAQAAGSGAGSGSAVAKKDEPKKDEPKKDEPKKDEPNKDVAKAGDKKDVAKAGDKKDVAKAGDKKEDKPVEKKPVGMKIDEAKAKLEAVRTAAEKDKQKFIDAAKTLNTDEGFKASGGDLGWKDQADAALGDKAVTDAIKTLKPGEMTPVITTDRGAYLILAEAERKGDLSYDQVKLEIAKPLAKDVWSKEAAKRAAIAALAKAREGKGFTLDQLYEKEQQGPQPPANPGIDIEQLLNDPNLTPEQKEQIRKAVEQSGQSGQLDMRFRKSGPLEWESEDVPAAWKADQADGAGGSAKPAAGSAAGSPATAKPAAPTGGAGSAAKPTTPPGAGSAAKPATPAAAGSGSAAGSGAGSAALAGAPTGTPPAAPAELTPSSDKLPELAEVKKPFVERFGPNPREPKMPGIGGSKPAAAALFEQLTPGNLAKTVYEVPDDPLNGVRGSYVVIQLISRSDPTIGEFDKDADRSIEELRNERAHGFVNQWLKERCEKLLKEDKIKPNPGLLRDTDEQGKVLPVTYRPCSKF